MNYRFFIFPLCLVASFLLADEVPAATEEVAELESQTPDPDVYKVSEAFGHLIGKNIETLGFKFDIAYVIKGLQDAASGKNSPLSEIECVQAISTAQETAFKEQATENLKKADAFLSANASQEGIVVLEEGKLQYKIEKPGEGKVVEPNFAPVIRYTGKYLDGTVFGASKEDEVISLDETIPGFNKGIVGMKEGEKRILYIHPELGYGTSGYLPPNSLLTFEIECVRNQSSKTDAVSSATAPGIAKEETIK